MKVVYCANRAIYRQIPTAINSLLSNNKVEKIYLLIEDDTIDYINLPIIKFINLDRFDFIIRDGFNCTGLFPYMAMVRCILSKILTENKVLYLDVDTIVDGSISDLWNYNLSGNPIAGRVEDGDYINSGVLLMDLAQIRGCKYDDRLLDLLKRCRFVFPDQDAINIIFKNRITRLPKRYNQIGRDEVYDSGDVVIRHFAGIVKPWKENATAKDKAIWNKYKVDHI